MRAQVWFSSRTVGAGFCATRLHILTFVAGPDAYCLELDRPYQPMKFLCPVPFTSRGFEGSAPPQGRRFPESRRKAYYLMSIHEHLPPQARKDLKSIGWTKGRELAKLARAEGKHFDCAPWVHKARSMPREEFTREVERELTGLDAEPSELIYFKVYKSQAPVIEKAIDTAALMLGSDKSRGYCLEMICADFLAGAQIENGDPEVFLLSMLRLFRFLPAAQRQQFLQQVTEAA
jgi:hypothetical protein